MRPLRLELSAFRSYAAATVEWSEHDLVVIDGPTGAGKTSLLDAIAYALYGRTPASSRPGELLGLGHDNGEVRLTYSVAGETWRVTRRIGPAAPEPLHMLERLGPDSVAVEVIVGEGPVDARVEQLLGMSFAAFTSTVLLAQGRFDQFLRSRPAERDRILRELFGVESLEAARLAADGARSRAEAEAQILAEERRRLPPGGGRALADAASHVRERAREVARLRFVVPLAASLIEAESEARALAVAHDEISSALAQLPDPDRRDELRETLVGASAHVGEAKRRAAAALTALEEAQHSHDDGMREVGANAGELGAAREAAARLIEIERRLPGAARERARLGLERDSADLRAQRAARASDAALRRSALSGQATARLQRAQEAERAERNARQQLAGAEAAAADAASARRDAEVLHADSSVELEHARHEREAAHLRAELSAGDPCPVCGNTVGLVVPGSAHADIAALRGRVAEHAKAVEAAARLDGERQATLIAARRLHDAASETAAKARRQSVAEPASARDEAARAERLRTRAEAAAGALRAADVALASTGAEVDALARERDGLLARLERWAGTPSMEDAIAASERRVAALAEELAAAQAGARAAAEELDAARARLERVDAALLTPLKTAVMELERALERPSGLDRSWTATLDSASELASAGADRVATLSVRIGAATAAASSASMRLEREGSAGRTVAALRAELASAMRDLEAARGDWLRTVAAASEARRLEARERLASEAAARHGQIARDLRADRFPRFLLQRYRSQLAVAASARLHELSGGRFRFASVEPDPLAVVDVTRGERTRSAATLSGGEGFVASLALALGLGDVASSAGGRLECLFLDEGFSTLDADSLETALAAVERLGGGGRLVGVITHLPGVAERLGAAIHVARDPDGRSRILEGRRAA